MKFNTKFNHKDKVILIENKKNKIWTTCSFCNGTGKIVGADSSYRSCPTCRGAKGHYLYDAKPQWLILSKLTIGEIRITDRSEHNVDDVDNFFSNYGSQKPHYEEKYMCYETGIGSGTVWDADNLFKDELTAQQECDRRNKE